MRIALFTTCLADAMFPRVPMATATVLERLGHEVVVPEAQTCCGQMHLNTGYWRLGHDVVRHHTDTFERVLETCDAVVAPSGSCVGSVRHQHGAVARRYDDAALAERTTGVAARTYELSELLVDVLGVTDVGAWFPHRVTYHPTCHSLRMLRVGEKPERLLRAVEGLDLVELPGAESCCGFGGTFALKNAPTSGAMLGDKIDAIGATGAEVCTAGDSSCLMHIGGGLARLETGASTVHLAEILASTRAHPWTPGPRRRGAVAATPDVAPGLSTTPSAGPSAPSSLPSVPPEDPARGPADIPFEGAPR
ncbi:(Fe-S)-binding protein [Nocardioides lentus]|uniref:(Fe-S)-binding protein n=1 Tax=Nocardioides lentus TaxID=338077 RepID=A0ABN2PAJ0_9ACTN